MTRRVSLGLGCLVVALVVIAALVIWRIAEGSERPASVALPTHAQVLSELGCAAGTKWYPSTDIFLPPGATDPAVDAAYECGQTIEVADLVLFFRSAGEQAAWSAKYQGKAPPGTLAIAPEWAVWSVNTVRIGAAKEHGAVIVR
jgi:hypothetical protein